MQVIADDAGRALDVEDTSFVKNNFPKADTDRMKYLGIGGMRIDDRHSDFKMLCDTYSCLPKETVTKVYFSSNDSYAGSISNHFKQLICPQLEYKCIDAKVHYVTYNCIGWTLGVSKWLHPQVITSYIAKGLTHKQAIEKFASAVDKAYPSGHISNLDNIASKVSITKDATHIFPFNNTIGFYFNGSECLHGSRFLKTVNKQNVNQWTSKLGEGILVSHETEDLLYNDSIYGNTAYYFGLNDHIKDEL